MTGDNMGKVKQLHIDCTATECLENSPQTCYMLEVDNKYDVQKD